MRNILGYRIIDVQTQAQVGKDYSATQRKRCHTRADKLDLEYGAVRYTVQIIWG